MNKYDAFISYHHSEYDSWVAERIHKYIEHYHIPRAIQMVSGKKKFERVFRDKEELQLSADLTHEIYQVLEKAEFLIVICSPGSKNSLWVNKEVEYFLKFHDQDRVFPVLTEGEAETSFPDCIMHNENQSLEHLAADFRNDKKKFTRYMKTEMLRIISRMLSVSFDALKQRHRAYRRMQISVAAGIVLTVGAIFTGSSMYQRHQLDLENRTRLINQADYASERSLSLFQEGDKEGALEEALKIRDPKNPEKLMSPYQTYALNTALSSYMPEEIDWFVPAATVGSGVKKGAFSEKGTYYFTKDEENYITCYSVKDQSLLWELDSSKIDEKLEPIRERFDDFASSEIVHFKSYGDEKLLVFCNYLVVIVDAASGEITDLLPIIVSDSEKCDIQGDFLVAATGGDLYIYDLKTGKLNTHIPVCSYLQSRYGEEGYTYNSYHIFSMIKANSDATMVAFGINADQLYPKDAGDSVEKVKYPDGFYVYNQADQSIHCLAEKKASDAIFVDDQSVAVMHSENAEKLLSESSEYRKKYYASVYDLNSCEETMRGEEATVTSSSDCDMIYKTIESPEGEMHLLISYVYDRVFILNLDTGKTVTQLGYDARIQSLVDWGKKSFLVATKLGWAQFVNVTDSIERMDVMNLSVGVDFTSVSMDADTIVCSRDGSITFYEDKADEKMLCREYPHKDTYDLFFETYHHKQGEEYFMYYGNIKNSYDQVYLTVFDAEEYTAPKYEYICSDGNTISYWKFLDENGEAMLIFVERIYKAASDYDSNDQARIHLVHLASGEEKVLDIEDKSLGSWSLSKNHKGSYIIYLNKDKQLVQLYLKEDQISETVIIDPKNDPSSYMISGDGEYIYVRTSDDEWVNNLIYDCEADQFYPFDRKVPSYKKYSALGVDMSVSGHKLCFYDGKNFYLIDASTGETLQTIPYAKNGNTVSYGFFNHDENLLVCDNRSVLLYDLATGNFVDSYSLASEDGEEYELITGDSTENFMVFQGAANNEEMHGGTAGRKWLFSVDENLHMLPMAEFRSGFVDFACKKIIIPVRNNIYVSDYYTEEELVKEAEAIVGMHSESDEENMQNPNIFGSTSRVASRAFSNKEEEAFGTEDKEATESDEENAADSPVETSAIEGQKTTASADNRSVKADPVDFDEYNLWDFMEKTERIEAEESEDSYSITLSEEDQIQKIVSNIYLVITNNEKQSYYPVLKGRELSPDEKQTIIFSKDQEVLGICTGGEDYTLLYSSREQKADGKRSWISGKAAFKESEADSSGTQKYAYLHSEEGADGTISYILKRNRDGDSFASNTRAYLDDAKKMLSYGLAAAEENQYALSGATMPETTTNVFKLYGNQISVEDSDSMQLVLKPVSDFSGEFVGQVCIYYEDGRIRTTDFLPLSKSEEMDDQEISNAGVRYYVKEKNALVDQIVDDVENIEILPEVEGVPVTYIRSKGMLSINTTRKLGETVKSITIPASVEQIDPGVLISESWVSINLAERQKSFKMQDQLLMTMDGKRVLAICSDPGVKLVIPDGVEEIDPYVFSNCKQLKTLVLPEGLKRIGNSAFAGCPLTDLELPDSLEFLGDFAFYRRPDSTEAQLEEWIQKDTFRIGKNLWYLGSQALDSLCVKNYEVDPQNSMYQSVDGVIYLKDMSVLYMFPSARGGSFTVPDGVEYIREYAFYTNGAFSKIADDAWGVTELILSDSVKEVQRYAFAFADTDLRTIKAGLYLESLGDYELFDRLDLSGKTSIICDRYGNYYNADRSKLLQCGKDTTEYQFLESVRSIDSAAFNRSGKLEKILIPAGVNLDPDSAEAFAGDYNVRNIETIEVEKGNPDFSSVDGKLCSASGELLLGKKDE